MSQQLALVFPSAAPQLFVHEGARQSLERKLKAAARRAGPVVLSITDNRHSIISHAVKQGASHARIHHMFLDAPPRVIDALVRYVTRDEKSASLLVGNYIEANSARLARRRPRAIPLHGEGRPARPPRHLRGPESSLLQWRLPRAHHVGQEAASDAPTGRARRSSWGATRASSDSSASIRCSIRPWVPRYFVAYVVYHEMLHHMIPSARGSRARSAANARVVRHGRSPCAPPAGVPRARGVLPQLPPLDSTGRNGTSPAPSLVVARTCRGQRVW
ncbi:MAG: hypothetical protein QM811_09305 [Pirellulales bacterium]